ncbi:uncharacterized protein RSE6_00964 [Rhynchosporium secalis]|uniref:Uncharacterized protein n=1 Tax=Rhynchosporium secalis TaxID=38038 RepID=A0A1E1LWJ2_RHYSE|nr:uncharacterized protein RSE6_00964 [Rhynchosporium secalis]
MSKLMILCFITRLVWLLWWLGGSIVWVSGGFAANFGGKGIRYGMIEAKNLECTSCEKTNTQPEFGRHAWPRVP